MKKESVTSDKNQTVDGWRVEVQSSGGGRISCRVNGWGRAQVLSWAQGGCGGGG